MNTTMNRPWLDVSVGSETRRAVLDAGLTVVGGPEGGIPLPEAGGDRLHVWDSPPKMVFVGAAESPRVNGASCNEADLKAGDVIEWAGARLEFGESGTRAVLEEIPVEAEALPAAGEGWAGADPTAWTYLKAGMLVEMGAADRGATRRWQQAVSRGEFDPAACSREILALSSKAAAAEPRILERSGRLLRDLLMSPLTRGAHGTGRRVREATKGGAAFLIAQAVALGIYTLILVTLIVLARLKWDFSVDHLADTILDIFRG